SFRHEPRHRAAIYPQVNRIARSVCGLTRVPFVGSYPIMDSHLTRYEALIACRDRAGSDSQMGRDLGIPQSTMWRIINSSKQLPAENVLAAERLYGVSRHDLRPDIYPRERM